MAIAALNSADLKAVAYNGLINEDVMQQIWDISNIPLPMTDMIGSGSCKNAYKEWTTDELAAPDKTNATIDGDDASGNDSATGERIGNHCQIPDKVVQVSTRAQESDTIGRADELAYQIMMRQRELKRDVEAIICSEYGSLADDGDAVPGRCAGFFAMIRDSLTKGGNALVASDGVRPGFVSGVIDGGTYSTTNFAAGTTRALSEELVRDAAEAAYLDGGNPGYLMTVPQMIGAFSNYLFTSSARIASLYSDTGTAQDAVVAKGSVNVFVTDFGITLDFVPNRLMQPEVATTGSRRVNVGVIDPSYIAIDYLHGYRVESLAKAGTSDKRQMFVDFTLRVNSLDAHSTICDIDDEAAITQATA